MATLIVGPNGVTQDGDTACAKQDYLIGQGTPYGALLDIVNDQRLTGITEWNYDGWGLDIDRHMPMRANTAANGNITGTRHFQYDVGYDGIMNMALGRNIFPEYGEFDVNRKFRDSCGLATITGLASTANINAEACNPGLDGPMPSVGKEWYDRTATGVRMPIPPICIPTFTNKEEFAGVVAAVLRAVNNATETAFRVLQHRFIIEQSRYNAAPLYTSLGNGLVQLIDDPAVFKSGNFGHVPQHWGSAAWIASMIQYSEIPDAPNIYVDLPPAILEKYKQDYLREVGFNLWAEAQNITRNINGYITQALNDTLVYQHPTTGQKITFRASSNPLYVEVKDLGPETGTWAYQEKWVTRPSEQDGSFMRRRNPNWGRQCSCPGTVLAAIVTVTAETAEKPFYTEPLPGNNPDPRVKAMFAQYARGKGLDLNASLAEFYPSTLTTTLLTGLEAQVYLINPANMRAQIAGSNCDVASNVKNAWVGGFNEKFAQFVSNKPRQIANFLLRMPKISMCSVAPVLCDEAAAVPEAGDIVPQINPFQKDAVPVPDPVPPPTPPAGSVFMSGNRTTVTADCASTKTVKFSLFRQDGTAGAITVTIAGTSTAHGGTFPTSVVFADGEDSKVVSWTIPAWNNTDPDTATESYVLTLTGLDADSWQTRTICVKPPLCPGVCDGDTTGCTSCGTAE